MANAPEFPRSIKAYLCLLIILCPWPLASNRPLPEAIIALATGLALVLWALHALKSGKGTLIPWRTIALPITLLSLPLLWSALQAMPAPSTLAHPIWAKVAPLLGEAALWRSLSADPTGTITTLLRLLSLAGVFLLAFQAARDTLFARSLLAVVALTTIATAAYALAAYLAGNTHVVWLEKESYANSLTGPFINRNAFAAWCAMGMLVSIARLSRHIQREWPLCPQRNRLFYLANHLGLTNWLLVLGLPLLAICLVLTDSRAGLAAFAIGGAVFIFGMALGGLMRWKSALLVLLAGTVAAGALVATAGSEVLARLDPNKVEGDVRPHIWRATIEMIKDAPLTGHGLGTYEQLFLQYRTHEISDHYISAHNSYLELAAEWGLPAASLWFLGLLAMGFLLWKGLRTRRQGGHYPLLALAVLAQAAAHSMLDFSYQVTANALLLTILLAIGLAQSFRTSE